MASGLLISAELVRSLQMYKLRKVATCPFQNFNIKQRNLKAGEGGQNGVT